MSWFGSNKTGAWHDTYNKPKSSELGHVHRPVIVDSNGVKHPILGYQSHNSLEYMARTSQVVKYRHFPNMADEEYIPPTTDYGTDDLSGRKNEFSPRSHDERVRGPITESPWDHNGIRFNSPPSKDRRHNPYGGDDQHDVHVKGTRPNYNNEEEYYDDHENNRRINDFTKQRSRPNYPKEQEDHYEHANPRTNGYSPPKYSVPISTHLKGNDYHDTRDRTFVTPPRNETSYGTSKFKPKTNSPPQFNPQQKQEEGNYNQVTIDSNEARRRYGKGSPEAGPGTHAEYEYRGGTLNSKEAAKKYNGVLLTN